MDGDLETALRLRSLLNRSASAIDPAIAGRLQQARRRALARHRPQLSANLASRLAGTDFVLLGGVRRIAAALALVGLVALVGASYRWNQEAKGEAYSEIDSALLADDLPLQAYLDQGFFEWLEDPGTTDPSAPAATSAP